MMPGFYVPELGPLNIARGDGAISIVKSIQAFEIAFGTTESTKTAAINPVDTTKSIILFGGWRGNATASQDRTTFSRVELTDASTLTAYRAASLGTTAAITGVVVEFESEAVASVQYGTVALNSGGASATATIASVDTSKATALFLGVKGPATTLSSAKSLAVVKLTAATTVTATHSSVSGSETLTVGFCVVEFTSAYIDALAKISGAAYAASTDLLNLISLSHFFPDDTIIFPGGQTSLGTSNLQSDVQWIDLVAANYAAQMRGILSANPNSTACGKAEATLLRFLYGVKRVFRFYGKVGGGNTVADITIPTVNVDRTAVVNIGFVPDAGTTLIPEYHCATAKLLDAATVRLQRGGNLNEGYQFIEIVEFY